MSSDQHCAAHALEGVVGACGRCGTFGCATCLRLRGPEWLCAPCVERQVSQLPRLRLWSLLTVVSVASSALGSATMTTLTAVFGRTAPRPVSVLYLFGGLAALLASLAGVVFFLIWFNLVAKHALARGISFGGTSASAVYAWFVPFLNLTRPFGYARAILAETGGRPALATFWQVAFLASGVLPYFSKVLDITFSVPSWYKIFEVLAYLLSGVSAVLVIVELTRSLNATTGSSPAAITHAAPGTQALFGAARS